ncbi:enoyl-CoA hydratase/isomerase family protein [Photobacterium sp. SDRW27]|uniref:enoyl-CoA hydratase/isomerase family protein n=1 Tax=Photobacterium obscurum TaxID=2829490 RepID=UPI0022446CC1|nr:enoyl-CoA hydratase/isomerase family protein [Photobacterium obscurum]MCW8327883.1 enoyl-CoA hydratase/isomerase family protein [Photobacterium obscurum]
MNDLNLTSIAARHLLTSLKGGVLIITMNRPEKLNGWTMEMMDALSEAFSKANANNTVRAVILTGAGKYYSAGVNLGGSLKLMAPRKLRKLIIKNNQALFELFLNCNKPLLIAVNGPALGASVTSASLANSIIASENATFSTPFAALGITPEGCSSIHFPRLMGEMNAQRMLGSEGWKPTAKEAFDAGLIQKVVPQDQLMAEAERIAQGWVANEEERKFLAGSQLGELKTTNARESEQLADSFLGAEFLKEQSRFLWSKKKYAPSVVFFSLWALRPLWFRLI